MLIKEDICCHVRLVAVYHYWLGLIELFSRPFFRLRTQERYCYFTVWSQTGNQTSPRLFYVSNMLQKVVRITLIISDIIL